MDVPARLSPQSVHPLLNTRRQYTECFERDDFAFSSNTAVFLRFRPAAAVYTANMLLCISFPSGEEESQLSTSQQYSLSFPLHRGRGCYAG